MGRKAACSASTATARAPGLALQKKPLPLVLHHGLLGKQVGNPGRVPFLCTTWCMHAVLLGWQRVHLKVTVNAHSKRGSSTSQSTHSLLLSTWQVLQRLEPPRHLLRQGRGPQAGALRAMLPSLRPARPLPGPPPPSPWSSSSGTSCPRSRLAIQPSQPQTCAMCLSSAC